MKLRLTQIVNCSNMKVTPVEKIYPVKNHLYNLKEMFREIEELREKEKQLGIFIDVYA